MIISFPSQDRECSGYNCHVAISPRLAPVPWLVTYRWVTTSFCLLHEDYPAGMSENAYSVLVTLVLFCRSNRMKWQALSSFHFRNRKKKISGFRSQKGSPPHTTYRYNNCKTGQLHFWLMAKPAIYTFLSCKTGQLHARSTVFLF